MRRLLGWAAGLLSVAALARLLHRHRGKPAAPPSPDPAEELRRRLADQREPEPSPTPSEAQGPAEPLDERRARVHAKAQAVIDEMRESEDA